MSLKHYIFIQRVRRHQREVTLRIGYFRYNQIHRKDGPAIIWEGGELVWQQYGLLHNLKFNLNTYYYINGVEFTAEQYKIVKPYLQG